MIGTGGGREGMRCKCIDKGCQRGIWQSENVNQKEAPGERPDVQGIIIST